MGAVSCFVVQSTSPVHWSSPVIVDRHSMSDMWESSTSISVECFLVKHFDINLHIKRV